MKRAREEEAGPGASDAGGGGAGGGASGAQAETARKALLLSTQAVGVNAAAVRAARDDVDALFEAMLVWHEWDKGGGRRFTADELLRVGSRRGKPVLVRLALERGANVNASDHTGGTAAHVAAEEGNPECLKLLLEAGIDKDVRDSAENSIGMTVLETAALYGKADCVKVLLEAGADVDLANIEYGWTPLRRAAHNGDSVCLKLLLEAGADVDKADKGGWTTLCAAAEKPGYPRPNPPEHYQGQHVDCVRLLLEAGASVDANTKKYARGKAAALIKAACSKDGGSAGRRRAH